MFRKLLLGAILLFLLPALAFAQGGKLRGLVTDKETGEPLLGANVVLEGTTLGASTDLSGVYVVLAVPPGVYTVRASYIGYREVALANIRVHPNLTTTQDFQLTPTPIEVGALEVTAERPLVQRNTTNTVRMTTQEDIKNSPIRGLQNILSMEAGTVQQDGALHIRGGRTGEVAYFIDGVTAVNPIWNSENITVIQEAVEEIQMQAGGYTAEFGGANSGIVRSTMRRGGPRFTGTIDYRTDDFAKPGKQFLRTSAFGYRNGVVTLSGPVPGIPKLRFFVAGQHNYWRNRNPSFVEPFSTKDFIDPETGKTLGELGVPLVDDGFEGREVGEPLPWDGHVTYKRNYLPGSWRQENMGQGTLTYEMTKSIKLRFTGSYEHLKYPTQGANFFGNLYNVYFNPGRVPIATRKYTLLGLRATHILSPTTFYEVGLFYTNRSAKNVDPEMEELEGFIKNELGYDQTWKAYTDSIANAQLGYTGWRSRYLGPPWISTINNFEMEPPGYPTTGYYENSQKDIGMSLDFTTQLTPRWEIKAGGRFEKWTMREFSLWNIQQYMETDYGVSGESPYPWKEKYGDEWKYVRMVELAKASGARFIGYDIDGNKCDTYPYGPDTPIFASAYVQNKLEYRDLIVNVGFRYEMVDLNALKPKNPEAPGMDTKHDWLNPDEVTRTEPYNYILPRFNFSFPVTERTVFYTQYGKYIQTPALWQVYRGYNQLSRSVSPLTRSVYGWWGNYVGYTAKPEEITQYEMGIRHSLTDNFAFTLTGFYKNYNNQLRIDRLFARGTGELPEGAIIFCGNVNDDFSTNKGLELTLELRRTKRLAAKVNYTLSDTRGTGADSRSGDVVVSDEVQARYPLLMFPLDYHQPHRGTAMIDYRFGKGDGGKILQGLGVNVLLTFNSGHAYTKIEEPRQLGQADPWDIGVRAIRDPRGRHPQEPLNNSITPWNFNVTLNVDKVFYLGRYNIDLYMHVLNLFNTKNVINVYPNTGTSEDDGWLRSPYAAAFLAIPQYEDMYRAVNQQNRWSYQMATGNDLYGVPRQIRFGIRLEFK